MRRAAALALLVLGGAASPTGTARAQLPDTTVRDTARRDTTARDTSVIRGLDDDLAAELAFLYNGAAHHQEGGYSLPADSALGGSLGVREGSADLAGTVRGTVVVINGSLRLRSSARITGDVFVVGGHLDRAGGDSVGGRISVFPERLRYHTTGGDLVIAEQQAEDSVHQSWFRRWERTVEHTRDWFTLRGGVYNRVEGFPVILGPSIRRPASFGEYKIAALGIYRSVNGFPWTPANLGWDVSGEVTFAGPAITFGGGHHSRIDGVETWQLKDTEVSLVSFLFAKDHRDYYQSEGGDAWVRWSPVPTVSLTAMWADEIWRTRTAQDPFSLFNNGAQWRPNPQLDQGRFQRATGRAVLDTRNDDKNPWTGWLASLDLEYGWSGSVTLGQTSPDTRDSVATPVAVHYWRAFLDARRYNRLSPEDQLNIRLIYGGWLGGNPLPLERRFSMGGAGSLPGYDFREIEHGPDVFTCRSGPPINGGLAQCDQMLLTQLEYHRDFRLRLFGHEDNGQEKYALDRIASWMFIVDVGRGWISGSTADGVRYPGLPPIGTFRVDFGAGLDVHWFSVFIAKSATDWQTAPNFVLRLGARF